MLFGLLFILCNILGFSNSAIPTHKKSIGKIYQHNSKAIPNHRIVKITNQLLLRNTRKNVKKIM